MEMINKNNENVRVNENLENLDVIKQLVQIMNQQDLNRQSESFMEILQNITKMQIQFNKMAEELLNLQKEQSNIQKVREKTSGSNRIKELFNLQEKANQLKEGASAIRESLLNTAKEAVEAFKEKGREAMLKVLRGGVTSVMPIVESYRKKMVNMRAGCEKIANQLDSRISDQISSIDKVIAKMNDLSVDPQAKDERASIKDKLDKNKETLKNIENNLPEKKEVECSRDEAR